MGIQVVCVDVDVHEPDGIRYGLRQLGAEVRRTRLPVGDYRSAHTLVERKTVRDLHNTLSAGRLWGQLGRLRAAARHPILLVEGPALDIGAVSPAAIRGALLAAAEHGVSVVRSETEADSALWIYRIACRATRSRPAPDRPTYAQRPKSSTPSATAEAVLAAIPGISTMSARAVLARFGSLEAVVRASDADLTDVRGIGPARTRSLREALNHPHYAYRSRRSRERRGPAT